MSRPAAWWGASIGAMLVYAAGVLASFPPTLYYFPRLDSWGFTALPGELAIRWYGLVVYSGLGGLAGFVAGHFINRRPPWTLVWVIASTVMLVLAWHERHWFLAK